MLKRPHNNQAGTTKNKIDRHLKDINDTISEDDINNIGNDQITESRIIINDGIIEIADEKIDDYEENESGDNIETETEKVSTPWNIVS